MKQFVLGAIAVTVLAAMSSVQAADMPIKAPILKAAPYDPWTGTYIGGNAGYSWGDWKSTNVPPNFLSTAGFGTFGPGLSSTAKPNVDGWVAGAQLGHNWRVQNNWVVGLEGDFQWTREKARNVGSGVLIDIIRGDTSRLVVSDTSTNSWKLDWFSTVRARGGYLVAPQWLLYGTGGLAIGRANFSNTNVLTATITGPGAATASSTTALSESKTKAGWTLGTGVENQFAKNWSAKLEYLYVDLGSHTFLSGLGTGISALDTRVKLRDNIVRAGLNYQFH